MPYIKKEQRKGINELVNEIIKEIEARRSIGWYTDKDVCGNLTFIVFKLIKHFYKDGKWYDKADAEKVCKRAWHEFERRYLDPYEDEKIKENGDVE